MSVNPLSHKLEFRGMLNTEYSPALRATDYKCPHVVWEMQMTDGQKDLRGDNGLPAADERQAVLLGSARKG